jgi:hypothetical protein
VWMAALARNSRCSAEELDALVAISGEPEYEYQHDVILGVVGNVCTSATTIQRVLDAPECQSLWRFVARAPNITPEQIEQLWNAETMHVTVLEILAGNARLPADIREQARTHANAHVRRAYMRNPLFTKEDLVAACADENPCIRCAAVYNTRMTGELLATMADDCSTMVLLGIVGSAHVRSDTLRYIADRPDVTLEVSSAATSRLANLSVLQAHKVVTK